jgi:hypothetical protein
MGISQPAAAMTDQTSLYCIINVGLSVLQQGGFTFMTATTTTTTTTNTGLPDRA